MKFLSYFLVVALFFISVFNSLSALAETSLDNVQDVTSDYGTITSAGTLDSNSLVRDDS